MNKDFKENSGWFHLLLLGIYQSHVLWIFIFLSVITVLFIFITPFLLLFQYFLAKRMKGLYKSNYDQALSEFKATGSNVTNEIKNSRVHMLVDMEKKKFCYWWIGLKKFQPGIADFSEISSINSNKENDIAVEDAMGNLNKRKKGSMRIVINFDRFDQPKFDFPAFNENEFLEISQKLNLMLKAGKN